MQVYERRSLLVQRDMDLIRQLLLGIEQDPRLDGTHWISFEPSELGVPDRTRDELAYHLALLIEGGFVEGKVGSEPVPIISKLTWQGHELLDDIRDPDIWSKTKERVKGLSTVGVQLLWDLAKAELKKKLNLS